MFIKSIFLATTASLSFLKLQHVFCCCSVPSFKEHRMTSNKVNEPKKRATTLTRTRMRTRVSLPRKAKKQSRFDTVSDGYHQPAEETKTDGLKTVAPADGGMEIDMMENAMDAAHDGPQQISPASDATEDVDPAVVSGSSLGQPLSDIFYPGYPPDMCLTCYRIVQSSELVSQAEIPEPCATKCFANICRSCMDMYLDHYFFGPSTTPGIFPCPFCRNQWSVSDIENLIGKTKTEVNLERMTHRSLEISPTFRWCANDKCPSGQFFDEDQIKTDKKVCCGHCDSVNCFSCRAVWHDGLSCEEYQEPDLRKYRGKRGAQTEVRGAMRKGEGRSCPHCGTAVEKSDGCDSVRCEFL